MKRSIIGFLAAISLTGCAQTATPTDEHYYQRVDCDAVVNIYSYGLIDGNNTAHGLKRRVVAVSKHWDKKTYRIRDVNIIGMVSQDHVAVYDCRQGAEFVDLISSNVTIK